MTPDCIFRTKQKQNTQSQSVMCGGPESVHVCTVDTGFVDATSFKPHIDMSLSIPGTPPFKNMLLNVVHKMDE